MSNTCVRHIVHEWVRWPDSRAYVLLFFEVGKANFNVLFTLPSYLGGKVYII